MDFEGGTPGKVVVSDVAFVQDTNREILVVGASTDNNIVLVDLETFETRKLNLAPGVLESTGGGARMLEWAVGTDCVWVNGGEAEELYIIKIPGGIDSAVLDNQISGIPSGNMLFVNNFERVRAAALAQGLGAAATSSSSSSSATEAEMNLGLLSTASASSGYSSNGDSNSTLAVVGVVLGALGLIAGLGALYLVVSQKNLEPATAKKGDVERPVDETHVDITARSLGSKQVN
jgi:hypothetical protein